MRRRGLALVGVGALVFVLAIACSSPHCPYGIWPFPGQSAVPVDTIVEIRARGALPKDLPSVREAVGLRVEGGADVPVDVEVDLGQGLIRLLPRAPLQPDTAYVAWGLDARLLDRMHWFDQLPDQRVEAHFTTGSRPELLDVWYREPSLFLAFSEPIDLDTLEGRVRWTAKQEGEPSNVVTVVGLLDGEAHLVELVVTATDGDPRLVELLEGVVGESGVALQPGEALWVRHPFDDELEQDLARYRGLARCGGAL